MKYLLLSIANPVKDIEHALNILRCAIREAVHLDRTLVVGAFTIEAAGNLGHTLENVCYSQFVDLGKTRVCRIEDGDIVPVTESFRFIEETSFDLKAYSDKEVLRIEGNKMITAEQNNRHEVIVRQTIPDGYIDNYPDILVRFSPSTEVERLSNIVLKTIHPNIESIKKRLTIQKNMDCPIHGQRKLDEICYACLYVADSNYAITPAQIYAASSSQIKKTFKHLNFNRGKIKKHLALYVILVNRTPVCLDFLKDYHRVYYYYNFSELKALISGENGRTVNNAMLCSVEKNILRYADPKIIPYQPLSGFPIAYSGCSIKVPWRYKLMAWYKSLFKDSFFSS